MAPSNLFNLSGGSECNGGADEHGFPILVQTIQDDNAPKPLFYIDFVDTYDLPAGAVIPGKRRRISGSIRRDSSADALYERNESWQNANNRM